jgi:hypothetical protein
MDRRQVLAGMTAIGLAGNFNLNALANFQGAFLPARGNVHRSDRERAGLRGPVKTCADFSGDEVESMCEAEYGMDGRLLVWRGSVSSGARVERFYSYDETGRLVGIAGDSADRTDEFHFDEQGRKTLVRTVPPRPDRHTAATGIGILFEATEEGECLTGGGTITTRYNETDQPSEVLVRDSNGELLTRIVHKYDTDGRLVHETMAREIVEFPDSMFPEEVRGQLSPEQRQAMRAQIKALMNEHDWLFGNMERSYIYDTQGRVNLRHMKMGSFQEEVTTTYNEYGDEVGTVLIQSGSLDPKMELQDQRFEFRYSYQYDNHANWTEKTYGDGSSGTMRRTITYY